MVSQPTNTLVPLASGALDPPLIPVPPVHPLYLALISPGGSRNPLLFAYQERWRFEKKYTPSFGIFVVVVDAASQWTMNGSSGLCREEL